MSQVPARSHLASSEIGYPFDWMATFLEQIARPNLLVLRRFALIEWVRILDQWVEDDSSRKERFDTVRLERLSNIALLTAQRALTEWDPRFSLQAVQSLPHTVVASACQILPDDDAMLHQVLRTMRAVAASPNGVRWSRTVLEQGSEISLPHEHYEEIKARAPEIFGCLIGACHLLVWSQSWYRWAGKGRRIATVRHRCTPLLLDAINRWDGHGILLVPAIELEPNREIEDAVAAYDDRRKRQKSFICLAGILKPTESVIAAPQHRLWRADPRLLACPPTPVYVPKIDKTFTSPNWYPTPDTDWQSWILFLGKYFDLQLRDKFGLSAAELELCLAALGLVVERQTQCGWLTNGFWMGKSVCVLESPANSSDLERAVSHLVSVLQRGTVRVRGITFRNAVASELGHLGAVDSDALAHRFFDNFSAIPNSIGFPRPMLFTELDEDTCVYDMTTFGEFWDALLAVASAGDGNVGNVRADVFERQVRQSIVESLALTERDIPWPANKEVWEHGKNLGDVDFCFSVRGVLLHVDMKSWQRSSDYHIGHFHTIQRRQEVLEGHLQKVERRGASLLSQLKASGHKLQECLSLLVVATPEYLDPSRAILWNGSPPKSPKVVTPDELCALVSDETEFERTLLSIRTLKGN